MLNPMLLRQTDILGADNQRGVFRMLAVLGAVLFTVCVLVCVS